MSRKLRIEYPGAMYHVMNRGDQREDIFRGRRRPPEVPVHAGRGLRQNGVASAGVLPDAHSFPSGPGAPQPNLVFGMKWFLGVYTKRYNLRHKLCGQRFKCPIDCTRSGG